MIGQSVMNVSSGGRGHVSTLVAGSFLLILLVVLQRLLAIVPVAALAAVMIMVSINTFSLRSITRLRTNPLSSSAVMLATVGTVVATADLAKSVLVGVLLCGVFFAGKVSRLSRVSSQLSADKRTRTYYVEGQVFFASASTFFDAIDLQEPVEKIVIDVSAAHFWDISVVGALNRVVFKARRHRRCNWSQFCKRHHGRTICSTQSTRSARAGSFALILLAESSLLADGQSRKSHN